MKKKFLSLLCAMTIVGTMFSTMTIANAGTEGPQMVIKVEETEYDAELSAFPQYMVTVAVENVSDIAELTKTGSALTGGVKYTGKLIKGFQAYLTYDNSKYIALTDSPSSYITKGTFTSNLDAEKGIFNFNWQDSIKDNMIINGTFDIVSIPFAVVNYDSEGTPIPGDELADSENIFAFSTVTDEDSKVEIAVFNKCAAGAYTTETLVAPSTLTNVVKPLKEVVVNKYNVSVGTVENGTVTLDATGEVEENTTVNVTATAAEGYEFEGIYVNDAKIDGTSFVVTADSVVTAKFTKKTVAKEVVVTPVKGNANAEGKFTQAFKASIKGNDEKLTTVNFILSNGSKEWNSADNGKGWTGLNITGASPVTFGVNVLNVPSDATVTANFIAE